MDKIKQMEDVYIKEQKAGLKRAGAEMSHNTELGMRSAYSSAAFVFRILGQYEGDKSRKNKIIDALGIIEEEPSS